MADQGVEWNSALVAETTRASPTPLRSDLYKKSEGCHRDDGLGTMLRSSFDLYDGGEHRLHHPAMLREAAGQLTRDSPAMELRYG